MPMYLVASVSVAYGPAAKDKSRSQLLRYETPKLSVDRWIENNDARTSDEIALAIDRTAQRIFNHVKPGESGSKKKHGVEVIECVRKESPAAPSTPPCIRGCTQTYSICLRGNPVRAKTKSRWVCKTRFEKCKRSCLSVPQ